MPRSVDRQILVGENSLRQGRMTVAGKQGRLGLRQSAAGARQNEDGHLLGEPGGGRIEQTPRTPPAAVTSSGTMPAA